MKKKLTVGIFLALVVVLVASIVVVDGADAARPHSATANLTYTSNEDGTGNLTFTVSWEKYGAWGYSWLVGNTTDTSIPYTTIRGDISLNERTTFGNELVYDQSNLPCGQIYFSRFYLRGKNDRPIKQTDTIVRLTTDDCPDP